MKRLVVVLGLAATNAMALDFDSEWSKFDGDFQRLTGVKVASVQRKNAPVINAPVIKTVPTETVLADDEVLPEKNTRENVLEQVDPKSPDRLGYKLEDPAMRDKMAKLYKKPDTVVYSLTLTE